MTKRQAAARVQSAAALLGRRGGSANTDAQKAARARNGVLGGRPRTYRLTPTGKLQRLVEGRWLAVSQPYDRPARRFLQRQQDAQQEAQQSAQQTAPVPVVEVEAMPVAEALVDLLVDTVSAPAPVAPAPAPAPVPAPRRRRRRASAAANAERDRGSWEEERARVATIPRDVPLCSMCVERAVASTGDICAECLATWGKS